jgi:hypothetical protein
MWLKLLVQALSLVLTIDLCYRANYRLGKAQPSPLDGDNCGRVYPLSPQINPPLTLVKEKSNTRGESRVTQEKMRQKVI